MRVSTEAVNKAFRDAGEQIKQAAGRDGKTTQAELTRHSQTLDEPLRALVDSFYTVARRRNPGAAITARVVDSSVAYAKRSMVGPYDRNRDGLTDGEVARMSATAQLAVKVANVPAEPTELPGVEQRRLAATFVLNNSEGSRWDDNRTKLYPAIDDANNGLSAYHLSGERAVKAVTVLNAFIRAPEAPVAFDPAKQNLIVVCDSEDEIGFYAAVQNKLTGEVTPLSLRDPYLIQDIEAELGAERFAELFPEAAQAEYPDPWDFFVSKLLAQGEILDLGQTE